ncbi:hypothetical protein [Lysobacter changpingensis]|uniref:hypothetical protein n=1 Tax=Lysobacter changpingensis TaxID=2792784 RepID=UPI001A909E03|nr:hypothetical protein [Lysobacter changpingensis]
MEPTSSSIVAFLTAKAWVAIAGFAGAVLSLGRLKGLNRLMTVVAVMTGFLSAVFLTPLVMHYLLPAKSPQDLGGGVAHLIGLFATRLIPALEARFKRKIGADT